MTALAKHAITSSFGVDAFVDFVRSNQRTNPAYSFLVPGHTHHEEWLGELAQARAAHQVQVKDDGQRGQQEQQTVRDDTQQVEDEPVTSIPVRLIPAVVADTLRWSDPYTPADSTSIEIASKSVRPVDMDEYLTLRLEAFRADLDEYENRPGVSYSEVRAGMGISTGIRDANKEDSVSMLEKLAHDASDGSFRGGGGRRGREKGLGYHRSSAGQTEAALEKFRNMKKRGSRYGSKLN